MIRFRTEIEPTRSPWKINYGDSILLLGSCFSDEIGALLAADGFDALHNPLGPLFNPHSIANFLDRALGHPYAGDEFIPGPRGWHCLDFASRYSGDNPRQLAENINGALAETSRFIRRNKPVVILTLGSAYVYYFQGKTPVGNCHKFPAQDFDRRRLDIGACMRLLDKTLNLLSPYTDRVIITVSPVRHLDEGLHGNSLNKATLLLAAEDSCSSRGAVYFPSFEILNDDLRDYRFYGDDLRHPAPPTVEYIHEKFCETFMDRSTREAAAHARRASRQALHRPIL